MPYKKALVTGGAGFIGSHITRALLARDIAVVVLDDLSMGKRSNVPADAEFIEGNVLDSETCKAALDGVDVVFHEAARVSIRSSISGFLPDAETNFMGTLKLLQAAAESKVKRFMFASSMAVYADSATPAPITESHTTEPISPYGIAKLAAEKYCLQLAREFGIDCQVLRYFNTYGPGQTFTPYVGVITIFIRRLLNGESPSIFGDGEQRRDFVHVEDIVAANMLALETDNPYGLYNVGTGLATSVNDIAKLLVERIDPSIEIMHAAAHAGELRNSIADISAISNALGYKPANRIADRIDEIIEFYRSAEAE